ncbi:hypothetical protein, partial [Flagellimonas flava]|uniref:hypothetical protein n=1 Tax=Flagellimonas flava TaxID=570519 RepID=UPI003D65CF66
LIDGEEKSLVIDSMTYDGQIIKLKKSELYDNKEKKEEQKKFNDEYINKVLSFDNSKEAVVFYHKKDKEVFKIPLKELYFNT